MRNIAEIDRNFQTASVDGMMLEFHNALAAPFAVEGFAWRSPGGPLYRLPEHFTTAEINKDALLLAHHTAGGAVRFRRDRAARPAGGFFRHESHAAHGQRRFRSVPP